MSYYPEIESYFDTIEGTLPKPPSRRLTPADKPYPTLPFQGQRDSELTAFDECEEYGSEASYAYHPADQEDIQPCLRSASPCLVYSRREEQLEISRIDRMERPVPQSSEEMVRLVEWLLLQLIDVIEARRRTLEELSSPTRHRGGKFLSKLRKIGHVLTRGFRSNNTIQPRFSPDRSTEITLAMARNDFIGYSLLHQSHQYNRITQYLSQLPIDIQSLRVLPLQLRKLYYDISVIHSDLESLPLVRKICHD